MPSIKALLVSIRVSAHCQAILLRADKSGINFPYGMAAQLQTLIAIHGAYMGPTWVRQDTGGPHVGPMILVIWEGMYKIVIWLHHYVPHELST